MYKDYLLLAISSLRKRRLRSWLTMIGIFIGVAAVVSLISLGQGMEKAISEQFFQLGADKVNVVVKGPQIGPPGSNSDIQLTESDLRVVQETTGVAVAAGRLIEPITIKFNDKERFLYVASLPATKEERDLISEISNVDEKNIIEGRALDPEDFWKVMIGEDYSTNPRFNGKSLAAGDNVLINGQDVEVIGVFSKTGNPFVDGSFVMNEEAVRELLDEPEKYGGLAAQVSDGADISLVAESIEKDLRKHRNVDEGEEDFEVNTAEDVLSTFTTVLNVVTAVLVGIAAISLIVGGIGIMNTMYTSVLERRREIGIMKAIGARNSDVLTIFLIESGLLGLVGGFIGVVIGALISIGVAAAATFALGTSLIQANISLPLVLGSLAFSFIVGSLAGTLPAKQASELTPVEALRQ